MADYLRVPDDQQIQPSVLTTSQNRSIIYKYTFTWIFKYFISKDAYDDELDKLLPYTTRYEHVYDYNADMEDVDLMRFLRGVIGYDVMKVSAIILLKKLCDICVIMMMYNMSLRIAKHEGDIHLLIQVLPTIYFLDFIGIMCLAFSELISTEVGYSCRNLINSIIYRKILKFRLLYHKDYNEAQLIGFMQTDSSQIILLYEIIKNSIDGVTNILIFAFLGGIYVGHPIIVMITVFILLQVISIKLITVMANIQKDYLAAKDERLKQFKSVLNCLSVIKIFGIEDMAFIRVTRERIREIDHWININVKRSWVATLNWSSVYVSFVVMLAYMFGIHRGIDYIFIVPMSKMMMMLFYTTSCIPRAIESYVNLKVSMERVQKFLRQEDIQDIWKVEDSNRFGMKVEDNQMEENLKEKFPIAVNNRTCRWKPTEVKPKPEGTEMQVLKPDNRTFLVPNVTLEVATGELVILIGRVGGGKSSILYSLFNEMDIVNPESSSKYLKNDCIYLSQKPWILNKSVKRNIILNKPFKEELFQQALKCAGLKQDIDKMPQKEDTMAGKKGEKLSGGQRWRVALARAFYQEKSIVVVDDPLSALDNEIADIVMKELTEGILKNTSRLIVTHRKEMAQLADRIYLVESEKPIKQVDKEFIAAYFKDTGNYLGEVSTEKKTDAKEAVPKTTISSKKKQAEELLKNLSNEAKGISLAGFLKALRDMRGLFTAPLIWFIALVASFAEPVSIAYLVNWSLNFSFETAWSSLAVVASLYAVKSFAPPIRRAMLFLFFQKNLTLTVHSKMLQKVLHASIYDFHEQLASGLIMNRTSNDLGKVDMKLIENLNQFMNLVSVLTYLSLTILFTIHYSSLLFLVVFVVMNVKLQRRFIEIRRKLTILQSGSMTPVLDHLDDTLADLTSIRVLSLQDHFFYTYRSLLDIYFNNSYLLGGFNIWFNTLMSVSSIVVVQIPCFLLLLVLSSTIEWNRIVVFIVLVGNLAGDLQRFLFFLTEFDSNFVDLDRCYFFEKIPYEKGVNITPEEESVHYSGSLKDIQQYIATHQIPPYFSRVEELEFKDVKASYGNEMVLKGISCKFSNNQTVGIIGRSGSGKSTMIKLIWRYLCEDSGKILINGKDISLLEVRSLRKSICVLSQESHIFTGSLRLNVDPLGIHPDTLIQCTLEDLGFTNPEYLKTGLDLILAEEGKNISVGERQIICLARIMLTTASVVILDEATASMDHRIDEKVKKKVFERFFGKAIVLIIAHRINSIISCDRILALADGRIVEEGSPSALLDNPNSYLKKMYGDEKLEDAK